MPLSFKHKITEEEIKQTKKNIEENKFIKILPNLRFAFTNLTPTETERLSLIIAKLYKTKESNTESISEEEIQRAKIIDRKIAEEMSRYEIFR